MGTVAQMMDLSGRKALVAGGAGHIGRAVGETLVELGANVSILDLDMSASQERVSSLTKIRESSASAISADLSDETSTRSAVQKTIEKL